MTHIPSAAGMAGVDGCVQRLFGSVFLEVFEICMSLSEQHESGPLSLAQAASDSEDLPVDV